MKMWITLALSVGVLLYLTIMLFLEGRRKRQTFWDQEPPPDLLGENALRCVSCGAWNHPASPACIGCKRVLKPLAMLVPGFLFFGYLLIRALWGAPLEMYLLAAGLCAFGWVFLRYGSRELSIRRRPRPPSKGEHS